jgi:hypothetical protein
MSEPVEEFDWGGCLFTDRGSVDEINAVIGGEAHYLGRSGVVEAIWLIKGSTPWPGPPFPRPVYRVRWRPRAVCGRDHRNAGGRMSQKFVKVTVVTRVDGAVERLPATATRRGESGTPQYSEVVDFDPGTTLRVGDSFGIAWEDL